MASGGSPAQFLDQFARHVVAYGTFFGNVVLLPLWLQEYMGYAATLAGVALAPVGLLAILLTPVVGRYLNRTDPRLSKPRSRRRRAAGTRGCERPMEQPHSRA